MYCAAVRRMGLPVLLVAVWIGVIWAFSPVVPPFMT
jgi:hypothetical protein